MLVGLRQRFTFSKNSYVISKISKYFEVDSEIKMRKRIDEGADVHLASFSAIRNAHNAILNDLLDLSAE